MDIKVEINRVNILIETYQSLLTKKQVSIIKEKYQYDLSLKEIADNHKISRSAVLDSINKTIDKLEYYESKLKLIDKKEKILDLIKDKSLKNKIKEVL